jgi:hypothetical protein
MRRTDSGDHEGFLALQGPDAEWLVPGAELHGLDEIRPWLSQFWQAFSSYKHEHSGLVEVDGTVYGEGVWTGVNDGPLVTPDGHELPPTGRTISFRFAIVVESDSEAQQARSVHVYFDQLEFLGQLGLLPEPAAAA